ncbi:MAG: hypothetical protein C5B60_12100 [Chloroflexi bacterium]|nr:MAG: hypothetical protein C5B60_12100 [Chloroflexota bacterium]
MLRKEFEAALGRAICDTHFCMRLLTDPVDALADYGLGIEEALALDGLRAHSLADLTAQILYLARQTVGELKLTW